MAEMDPLVSCEGVGFTTNGKGSGVLFEGIARDDPSGETASSLVVVLRFRVIDVVFNA
jgi:hypothetical protein